MPPRAGTRSQAQPSQTQPRNAPRGTQSQRRARADVDEDEEMEEEDNDMAVDQDEGNDGDRGEAAVRCFFRVFILICAGMSYGVTGACEEGFRPREVGDILGTEEDAPQERRDLEERSVTPAQRVFFSHLTGTKHDCLSVLVIVVLGGKSRSFPDVMTRAQIILQKTFGMELVELHNVSEIDDPNQKVIEAMNVKKKGALSTAQFTSGANMTCTHCDTFPTLSYILRNQILHPPFDSTPRSHRTSNSPRR